MRSFFSLALSACLVFALGSLANAQPSSRLDVVGYKAWKTSRIDEAKAALQRLQVDAGLEAVSRPSSMGRIERRLEQAKLNVEIATDLTVNDYFVLYLKPLRSKDAFLEAARKLSPDEMGELMIAYQKQLSGDATDGGTPLASTEAASPRGSSGRPASEPR